LGLNRGVAVVGAGMTRFHHRLHADKAGREIFVEAAIEAADSVDNGLELGDVESVFVGNFSDDVFEKQSHTGAMMADWLGLNPRPAVRVEDACASSGVAFNLGVQAIASGLYDVVLVGGFEKMRSQTTEQVTDALAMAADAAYEASVGFTFPGLYASMATAYCHRYGAVWEDLAAVTVKNHKNGALNPKAHFQSDIMSTAAKAGESKGIKFKDEFEFLRSSFNPVVAYPLRLFDCCPVSDGAAAVILAGDDVARKFTDTPVIVAGIGQASDTLALHDRSDFTSMRATRVAAENAYRLAGLSMKNIDVADVHDCFTIAEVMATEDLGFFPRGQGGKAAVEGVTGIKGDKPVNADGGLKAKGHPVGATGAAMAYEMFKQLRCEAGDHQVAGAEVGLAHNVGAAGATVTVQIFRRG
jgi:acetyl-CoA C-acetyltransferase